MTEPAPAPRGTGAGTILASLLVGGVAGFLVAHVAGYHLPAPATVITGLLGALPSLVVAVALHEGGHLVAGLARGFRFVLYAVGPLHVRAVGGRLAWAFERGLNPGGGMAVLVPRDGIPRRADMAAVVAGGPLASLLAAAACLALFAAWTPDAPLMRGLWLGGVLANGLAVAVSTLPWSAGGLDSDGRQLLDLASTGHRREVRMLTYQVGVPMLGGVRPRDLDRQVVERLLAVTTPSDGSAFAVARLVAAHHRLDGGDPDGAWAVLEELAARAPDALTGMLGPTLAFERAYTAVRAGRPAAEARALLAAAPPGYVEPASKARTEAVLLLAEGQAVEALTRAREGLVLADRSIDLGGAHAEREWLGAVVAAATAVIAAGTAASGVPDPGAVSAPPSARR